MPVGRRLLDFFTGHTGTPVFNRLMIFAAENLVYLVPVALLYLWFAPEGFGIERGKEKSVFVAVAVVVSLVISYALGQLHSHPAPYMMGYDTLLVEEPENSFPSQHTTVVFAFTWPLFYLRERTEDGLVALLLASLVGFSRVYVGVHHPVDIVGGVVASLLGFTLVYAARGRVMDFADRCIRVENQLKAGLSRGR